MGSKRELALKKLSSLGCEVGGGWLINRENKISVIRMDFSRASVQIPSQGLVKYASDYFDMLRYHFGPIAKLISYDDFTITESDLIVYDNEFYSPEALFNVQGEPKCPQSWTKRDLMTIQFWDDLQLITKMEINQVAS